METVTKLFCIAAGGAAGAVARHLVNVSQIANVCQRFPLPTFFINVSGSFAIGVLFIVLNDRIDMGDNVRMALIVGFLGAFTTFSTFELELLDLVKERLFVTALAYLFLSVTAGFVGVATGIAVGRRI